MADCRRGGREPGPREFLVGIGRGAAGALIFGLPMLMTMELWQLGFYMERKRLLVLVLFNVPLLVMLARLVGFERTYSLTQAVRDAMIAYGLGILISAIILFLLGDLQEGISWAAMIGKVAIQAVPASIGALLGRSQLGHQNGSNGAPQGSSPKADAEGVVQDKMSSSYAHELFLMSVGALFLNLNVAPTEEIILISYKMTPWHALATIVASIAIMHAFVYTVAFKGTHQMPKAAPWWHVLVRFTLPGYIVAMVVSMYVLWLFGRLDGKAVNQILTSSIVLSFPGAIGAAAARLIL